MRQPSASDAITELDGYCEMGMAKEALAQARRILACSPLSEMAFGKAVLTILSMRDSLAPYRQVIESAYSRLSSAERTRVRELMLGFYSSLKDFVTAEKFVSERPTTYYEALFSMSTLLALGHLARVRGVAKRCERMLETERDKCARDALHESLADYYGRVGEWDKALQHWSELHLDTPHGVDALRGMVEIRVADAIQTARVCIKKLDEYKRCRRGDLEI